MNQSQGVSVSLIREGMRVVEEGFGPPFGQPVLALRAKPRKRVLTLRASTRGLAGRNVWGRVMADEPEDFNVVWKSQPPAPTRDKPIEVSVVGRRCVYVNSHRIAGGKPYVSENLPFHDLKTTLGDVLDAFSEKDIRAALKEKRARADYFAAYHARKAALASQDGRE